ncbi:DUF397 domain-containing protein [Streptomyces reniochalinae]|uniref:DUF397 domain-containing protein n=1 Tax=Streptomyces reniochalinae TaxID=2250578 RepID=A0A367EBK0_9ACTN|nr:DUF397 domain-containing protein [Streptomyces reniochalinae]RCG15434.1 DUF397 domain-containing protein [Streptomyces reniochalinae]
MSSTSTSRPTDWVKSTYSGGEGGNCVEWAPGRVADAGAVPVRDSKDTAREPLAFSPAAWTAFVAGLKG